VSQERGRARTRRRFLQTAVCAAGVGFAGCSDDDDPKPTDNLDTDSTQRTEFEPTRPSPGSDEPVQTPEQLHPLADEYETAIDVVTAGVDPNAEASLRDQLGDLGRDVLLYFPEGAYLIDGSWDLSAFDRLAMVGDGATLVPPDGYRGTLFYFGNERETSSFRLEGVTFDFSAEGTGPRPMNVQVTDDLQLRDVEIQGPTRGVRFDVTDPDGTGEIKGLRLTDGGLPGANAVGCLVTPKNRGELVFEECTITGFPNNGLYISPSQGPVSVVGGRYANNGIASVRVSGPCTVKDVTVECDRAPDDFLNMRGIWVRGGDCSIEGCDVQMKDLTYSDGAVVGSWRGTFDDTRIRVDTDDVPALSIKPDDETKPSDADTELGIDCTDIDIEGTAANDTAVFVTDYESCSFERVTVQQEGDNRDGFYLIRSDGSVIRDSVIDVTGKPIRLENTTIERNNVRTEAGGEQTDTPTPVRESPVR